MNEVFAKTQELGEALMRSEEYLTMKAAEDVAMKNSDAAALMAQYIEEKNQLEAIMRSGTPDPAELARHGEVMETLQRQLQSTDDIVKLTMARDAFNTLINQVNQVLRFIITGQMDDEAEDEGGCTGSCATCHGCH